LKFTIEGFMNIRGAVMAMACVVGLSGLAARAAVADTVLYDEAGFIKGQQSFSQMLNITGPGVLTVNLTNVSWPVQLSSLSFLLTTSLGSVGPAMSAGTESFTLSSGRYFALWYGDAANGPQDPLDLGVYGLKMTFHPYAAPPPVPLPASVWLLLSGLALLAWQFKTRRQPQALLS
jgi:hypothetical protein